jgi:predicted dehydrogenase
MKDTVRLGVVGAGAIAQLAHLPVLARIRGAELTAICDNDRPKARALADRFGVPDVVTDIEDLLELDSLDAVVVATPNHLHEPHVLSALASKLHVLCERPLSLTSRGVERIISAATRADRVVAVANNYRYRTDVQTLSRFLQGGELGKTQGMRAGAYTMKRVAEPGWRSRRAEAGGGVFLEDGVALLDLALWLADSPEPLRVSAHMDRGRGAAAVEDAMLVQLECAAGVSFLIDVSSSYVGAQDRWWFEVLATRGSARLAPLRVVKELNGRAIDVSPSGAAGRESAFIQSYRAELAHFISMVRGETPYDPPADQVTLHRVVEAIYKSADEGREIRF